MRKISWNCEIALAEHRWNPAGYRSFYIHDPKKRLISAAPFADRVVHHALCNIIEPTFERSFVVESFANRLGKGNHRALNAAQRHARSFSYVLQLDVQRFFPRIDHAILRGELGRRIEDRELLWLIDRVLASGEGVLGQGAGSVLFSGDDLLSACQ